MMGILKIAGIAFGVYVCGRLGEKVCCAVGRKIFPGTAADAPAAPAADAPAAKPAKNQELSRRAPRGLRSSFSRGDYFWHAKKSS
jgi:hypothetical protein